MYEDSSRRTVDYLQLYTYYNIVIRVFIMIILYIIMVTMKSKKKNLKKKPFNSIGNTLPHNNSKGYIIIIVHTAIHKHTYTYYIVILYYRNTRCFRIGSPLYIFFILYIIYLARKYIHITLFIRTTYIRIMTRHAYVYIPTNQYYILCIDLLCIGEYLIIHYTHTV